MLVTSHLYPSPSGCMHLTDHKCRSWAVLVFSHETDGYNALFAKILDLPLVLKLMKFIYSYSIVFLALFF